MANPEKMKLAIQAVIKTMMDRVMNRVLVEDPFAPTFTDRGFFICRVDFPKRL